MAAAASYQPQQLPVIDDKSAQPKFFSKELQKIKQAIAGLSAAIPTLPTLGTASSKDVGVAAGNVVQLDVSDKLPAVDGSQLTGITASQVSGLPAAVPTGAIFWFPTTTAPSGYLEADGSSLLRTAQAALFALIGTTYGSVDGTHFNLPDLRGEFIRGYDHGRGVDTGRSFGSSQTDAFQGHYHQGLLDGTPNPGDIGIGGQNSSAAVRSGGIIFDPITDGTHGTPRTASETRPVNVALLPCIKT